LPFLLHIIELFVGLRVGPDGDYVFHIKSVVENEKKCELYVLFTLIHNAFFLASIAWKVLLGVLLMGHVSLLIFPY